ncbi:MAG: YheT family hydrolase [Bdellovibrionales bacterium]
MELPNFSASRFLPGGHLQTIVAHLLPVPSIPGPFERWIVELEDGDELWCRFYAGTSGRTVVLFHGLGGSADSKYMQIFGTSARKAGHTVLLVNHRGSGEGLARARGIYHSGAIKDVAAVIRYVRKKRPTDHLVAVGISLSANLLLNAAALLSSDLPDQIYSFNPPIDLHKTAACLLQPSNFVYDQKFVRDLKINLAERMAAGAISEVPSLPRFCRLVDFDELVTAPWAGFKSRDDYYTKCSSRNHMERVQVPSTIVMSDDDPFIPTESFKDVSFPKNVRLHLVRGGGHVGYLDQGRWLSRFDFSS